MGEKTKSWWETLGGLMTGIAALITAITGSIVALHSLNRGSGVSDTAAAANPPAAADLPDIPRDTAKTHIPPPKTGTSGINRSGHVIRLAEKREFVIGPEKVAARYILQTGIVSPFTAEADLLRIHVRLVSLTVGQYASATFTSSSFTLVIDGDKRRPRENFNYQVASQKDREEDVIFVIPIGLKRATLKIGNHMDGVDIPLDLTPADGAG